MLMNPAGDADTIVAPATAPGPAALAIVRISGPRTDAIVAALAPSARARPSHRLCRAALHDAAGAVLDEGMVVQMRAPRSFTGEDMAELHLHGAPAIVAGMLAACTALGARLAAPGEFTQRAFAHGRLDLTQAEAVADLTHAASEAAAVGARTLLAGGLSRPVARWTAALERLLAAWQAEGDFPDADHDAGEAASVAAETLARVTRELGALRAGTRLARPQAGHVVLAGAPNAGKSTLLNAWAGEERALVDAVAGTTRDAVTASLCDGGVHWVAVDTAGLHADATGLEARGGELACAWAERAELVLWLHPAHLPWARPLPLGQAPLWVVASQADRPDADVEAVAAGAQASNLPFAGAIAAAVHQGTVALRARAVAALGAQAGDGLMVRARHQALLDAIATSLDATAASLAAAPTAHDLAADALRPALRALGALTGRDVDAATLDRIFAEFCIGK